MENLGEGINGNGSIRIKQDKIVDNFIKSFVILRIILKVINIIIRLSDIIRAEEQDFEDEEFYSFNSIEGAEKVV